MNRPLEVFTKDKAREFWLSKKDKLVKAQFAGHSPNPMVNRLQGRDFIFRVRELTDTAGGPNCIASYVQNTKEYDAILRNQDFIDGGRLVLVPVRPEEIKAICPFISFYFVFHARFVEDIYEEVHGGADGGKPKRRKLDLRGL